MNNVSVTSQKILDTVKKRYFPASGPIYTKGKKHFKDLKKFT